VTAASRSSFSPRRDLVVCQQVRHHYLPAVERTQPSLILEGMQSDNGVATAVASNASSYAAPQAVPQHGLIDAGQQKTDLVRQLGASTNGDGSFLSQLTSNPFFTAVG
jgi:hypothetical protein